MLLPLLLLGAACGTTAAAHAHAHAPAPQPNGTCTAPQKGVCLTHAFPILAILKGTDDAGLCCKKCAADAACVSWNINTNMKACFLRGYYLPITGMPECTSGQVRPNPPGPAPPAPHPPGPPAPPPAPTPPPPPAPAPSPSPWIPTPPPVPPAPPVPVPGKKKHVIAILADDYGWADAGWHRAEGYTEVQTPYLDDLVKEGIELDRQGQACGGSALLTTL